MEQQKWGWLAELLKDLIGLFDTKRKASITVTLICVIVWLYLENKELNGKLYSEAKLSQESERKIYEKLLERYDPAFSKIKEATDSSIARVDSTTNEIKPVLMKLNEKLNK